MTLLTSHAIALAWTCLILIGPPLAALATRRQLWQAPPPRLLAYLANAVNLAVASLITLGLAYWNGVDLLRMFAAPHNLLNWLAITIGACLALSALTLWVRRVVGRPVSALALALLPRSFLERVAFALLCVVIGVGEEFLFRGFAFAVLRELMPSMQAIAIVTMAFALMHGIQDPIGIARALLLAVILAIPLLVTGSLVPSVAAHIATDLFVGLLLGGTAASKPSPDGG